MSQPSELEFTEMAVRVASTLGLAREPTAVVRRGTDVAFPSNVVFHVYDDGVGVATVVFSPIGSVLAVVRDD